MGSKSSGRIESRIPTVSEVSSPLEKPYIVKRMSTSNGTVYYQQPAAASNSSAVSANCRDPSRNPASSDSISSKNFKVSNGGIQNEIGRFLNFAIF